MRTYGLTRAIAAFSLSWMVSVAAHSAPTTYTFHGIATGMVGNESVAHDPRVWVPFTDIGFSLTAHSRSEPVAIPDSALEVPLEEVLNVTLDGLGDFIIVADSALFVDQSLGYGALASAGGGEIDFSSPALALFDGTSDLGPISVATEAVHGTYGDVELEPSGIPYPPGLLPGTELELLFTDVSALTFTVGPDVMAVPEPAIAWLMALGLPAIVVLRGRCGRRGQRLDPR